MPGAAEGLLGLLEIACWVAVVRRWLRKGMPTPRWVHALAVSSGAVGIACAVQLSAWRALTVGRFILLLFGLPVAVYVGWLWLCGPDAKGRQ